MAIKELVNKLPDWIKKYKFILLIIVVGLFLMMIPGGNDEEADTNSEKSDETIQSQSLEEELAEILYHIEGAGKVKVMLTIAQGEEIVYQTNDTLSSDSEATKEDTDTVTVTDSNRNQNGLIRQTNPPVYLGAIIVCQGADDPIVKLAITDAVAKITGLKTNQISVLKMK